MDPELEEAGNTAGGNRWNVLHKITFPLMAPGMVSVGIYYTIILIEMFEIPLAIGLNADYPVMSTFIFTLVHPQYETPSYGMAACFGVFTVLIGVVLANLYLKVTQHAYKFAVIRGRRSSRRLVKLGWWKYVGLSAVLIYLLIKVILPFLALLWTSLFFIWTPPAADALNSMTLGVYRSLFQDQRIVRASVNSLMLLLSVGSCTMLLGTMISWIVVRSQKRITRLLDALAFLPRAIPSVVISLGVLFTFIRTPIYGTLWILFIGHMITYLPFAVRITNASLLQIHGELEEASFVSGAGILATLRRIMLPLLRPAVWNGWLWVVAHSVRDFTFPLMLGTSTNLVIAQLLWQYWDAGLFERAAALSVVLITLLILLVVPARYYINRFQAF
jgi:iron(III) transport system permease protein